MKQVIAFGILIFALCFGEVAGQTILDFKSRSSYDNKSLRLFPKKEQQDSISAIRNLNKMVAVYFDEGYLAASIDSVKGNKDTLSVFFETGSRYEWMKLSNGNVDEGILTEAGFREKLYDQKPLRPSGVFKLNSKILGYCENHGYPFASLQYKDFLFEENKVTAKLYLQTEKLISIDSIIIRGNSKLSATYLYNYLSVKPGDLYNESTIRKISSRLRELPMVTETKPFNIAFTDETARIILQLDDKKASQVDGIIGVLPDNSQAGKVQITGDLRIRLMSSFGHGELFDLNWKQPQSKTQDLKVKLNYPFILNTPFGIDLNLGIYKKDTSYLEVALGAGVQFLLKGGNYLKVFVNDKKSSLLSTKTYENASTLPPFADVRVTSYGIGYKSLKLDYRLNPRKGYSVEASASVGNKTIKKNGSLRPEVYDSLDLKSVQYSGEGQLDLYFPLFSRSVINLGFLGAGISGENTFDNELFRFGGLKTLRGFDEESITTSLFSMGKLEYRYILEQNSYLFLFVNGAWYERNTRTGYISDTPLGFGVGITFETKLGIFYFNYALGKEFNEPIRFRAAKIHFGLINYF